MKRRIYLLSSFLFLCLMLLMPGLTLAGAREGLVLWFQNLLPALFPFMILSSLILGLDEDSALTKGLSRMSSRLFGISGNGCFAIFAGILCGYPLGAKITAQMIRNRKLSAREGQYLISFCNIASPGFLIQYVTAQCLGSMAYLPPMLFSIYGAALLTALLLQLPYRKGFFPFSQAHSAPEALQAQCCDIAPPSGESPRQKPLYSVNSAIMESFEAMVRLGGYLVLFSIIAKMVTALFTTVTTSNCLLIGVIEITNGAHYIVSGSSPLHTKLMLLSFCVSFGGLSCYAQTAGMCHKSGLSMPYYLAAKLLNGLLALLLIMIWCMFRPVTG